MSDEQLKEEIEYYTGRTPSEQEVKEIQWYAKTNKCSLSEIISAYYDCVR